MVCSKYIQLNHLLASIEHGKPDVWELMGYWYEPRTPGFSRKALREMLDSIPAANVIPARYGRWELHKDGSGTCSECGCWQDHVWDLENWQSESVFQNYCGRCGADMREYVEINGKLEKNPRLKGR